MRFLLGLLHLVFLGDSANAFEIDCPEGASPGNDYKCYSFRETVRVPVSRPVGELLDGIFRPAACSEARDTAQKLGEQWARDNCEGGIEQSEIRLSSRVSGVDCYPSGQDEVVDLSVLCKKKVVLNSLPFQEHEACFNLKIKKIEWNKATSTRVLELYSEGIGMRRAPEWSASEGCGDVIDLNPGGSRKVILPSNCTVTLTYPHCRCLTEFCFGVRHSQQSTPSEQSISNEHTTQTPEE